MNVLSGTGHAWAPGSAWKAHGRVFAWGGQWLFVIPHSGVKNNWLRASNETEASRAVAKKFRSLL